jgi:uncharacterized membrane protein YedE/YeeE
VIPHLSFWLGGLLLALVPILHWALLHRALAVSGRFTALVDRLRFGKPVEAPADTDALLAALRAETIAAFGEGALATPEPAPEPAAELPAAAPAHAFVFLAPERSHTHAIFFFGLVLGGLLSALSAGAWVPTAGLNGELFARTVAVLSVPAPLLLGFGGVLVGFGTRMASGCTSGHGLCGLSQLQPGSMVATLAFFGAGVIMSLGLGALL